MRNLRFILLPLAFFVAVVGYKVFVNTAPSLDFASITVNRGGARMVTRGIEERSYKVVTLSSGKKIKFINTKKLNFAHGQEPPGLLFKYQTDLPIGNVSLIRKEALHIWKDFRIEVEKSGLTAGIITAVEAPKFKRGPIWHRRTYTFAWKKNPDGTWNE